MVNLADLDRARGQDQRGAELLRHAMAIERDNADIRHALGLLLVRQHDYAAALPLLRQASELVSDSARYAYVYAGAPNSAVPPQQAIAPLEQAHEAHPTDWDLLSGLAMIARDIGDISTAQQAAREMVAFRLPTRRRAHCCRGWGIGRACGPRRADAMRFSMRRKIPGGMLPLFLTGTNYRRGR